MTTCAPWAASFEPPTAAECYRYVLQNPAVYLALTAPKTREQLGENLAALNAPELSSEAAERWQAYGDLIYGNGQDSFETRWL